MSINRKSKITKFQTKDDFPTSSVQPTPFVYPAENSKVEKIIYGYIRLILNIQIDINTITNTIKHFYATNQIIIYSTRYEIENPQITGIISCNLQTGEHKPIELWCNSTYFPRWNTLIFNQFKDEIIFVGGSNVNKENKEYTLIAFYDMKTHNISTTDINYMIGSNSKAVLVDQNSLHIIGGQFNDKHILFDLTTKQASFIYSFKDTNPGIQEHGMIYDPIKSRLMMFGGYYLAKYKYYNDFWMLNFNKLSKLSMIDCATFLVNGYMKKTFLCNLNDYNSNMYDMELNKLIILFVGHTNIVPQWNKINKWKMINGIRSFGTVFYDYRIIIVLGGIEAHHLINTIYYLDVNSAQGWKRSMTKCPRRGMCNTVLIDDKIHILPYYAFPKHYVMDVKRILPKTLLKK